MKKKLKLILILIFTIIVFSCLNNVCALDITIDNNVPGGINKTLSDGYDTIYLESGIYSGNNNSNININTKNITLIGSDPDNVIIDASYASRFFEVSPNLSLTLINITLINGSTFWTDDTGGFILNHGKLNLINTSFINGGVEWGQGGAIYVNTTGTVNIINCSFINISSGSGAAIFFNYRSLGNITDSNFINNTVPDWGVGGAIFFDSYSSGNITDSNFINNTIGENGGAIYINGDVKLNIDRSRFISNNNQTGSGSGYSNGGCIYINSQSLVNITNSEFLLNKVKYGGAIFINGAIPNITNCTFANNSALEGGSIYVNVGSVNLNNSTFIENKALNNGGSIYINEGSSANIFNNKFTNNSASYGGAIFLNKNAKAFIDSNIFQDNLGENSGGSIYINPNASANVSNCNFTNNSAITGGTIFVNDDGLLHIINSNLFNNNASNGGCIYINTNAFTKISDVIFKNNIAEFNGGAIYVTEGSVLNISASFFINNSAEYGGAIQNNPSGLVNINKSTFNNNNASYGGAIYNENILNVNETNFNGNTAIDGSAIMNYNGSLTFYNNVFTNNIAEDGRTVPFKYIGTIIGNLFNNIDMSGNQYIDNIEQFNTTLQTISVEIINKHIVVKVRAYDIYNRVFVPEGRTISFTFNGIQGSNLTDSNGIATFHYRPYETNLYNISAIMNTVVYDYDNVRWNNRTYYVYKFSSANSSIFYTIYPTKLIVSFGPGKIGENVNITITLLDEQGKPLPYQLITLSISGVNGMYGGSQFTDNNGKIILTPYVDNRGRIYVDAYFDGEGTKYEPSHGYALALFKEYPTELTMLIGNGNVGDSVNIIATLFDEHGKPLANQKIVFSENGVVIGSNITNTKGIAMIKYHVTKSGEITIHGDFTGEKTKYGSSQAIATKTFLKQSTQLILKISDGVVGDNVKIIARLLDDNGNPVPDQKILFIKDKIIIGSGITNNQGIATITYYIDKNGKILVYAKFNGEKTKYGSSQAIATKIFKEKSINNEISNNPNSQPQNNIALMKPTGIPIIFMVLILLSALNICIYKKK